MKFNILKKLYKFDTANLEEEPAYNQSLEYELISILLTSFVENKFYITAKDEIKRFSQLIKDIPYKKFIAQATIYARNEMGMRSITHVAVAQLCLNVKGESWLKDAINKIIFRPDDILEIVAYYFKVTKKKSLPAALRKGISLALNKFDRYQIAKYKKSTYEVKMVDILNLVHPKPNDKTAETFKDLINGSLGTLDTWESKLSSAGKATNPEEVKDLKNKSWKELLETKKIGYLALLRNLRNISTQSHESIELACNMISDANLISKSKVFPFQLMKALEQFSSTDQTSKEIQSSIIAAMELSLSNIPVFPGRTLIALDVSGSMKGKPLDIGSIFAAAFFKKNNSDIILFSNDAKLVLPGYPSDTLATMINNIKLRAEFGGTNFNSIFTCADKAYDRIIILSDMQAWNNNEQIRTNHKLYNNIFNCDPYIYSFDLAGHGTMQFPENKVFCIAGFSDKIFNVMNKLEQDKNVLINHIKAIEI